jgi:RNA-splicing ligase RtcB
MRYVLYERSGCLRDRTVKRPTIARTRSYRSGAEEAPDAKNNIGAVAEAAEQTKSARRAVRLVPLMCVKR